MTPRNDVLAIIAEVLCDHLGFSMSRSETYGAMCYFTREVPFARYSFQDSPYLPSEYTLRSLADQLTDEDFAAFTSALENYNRGEVER